MLFVCFFLVFFRFWFGFVWFLLGLSFLVGCFRFFFFWVGSSPCLSGQSLGSGIFLEHGVAKGNDVSTTQHGFWLSLSVLLNAYVLVGVDGWCSRQIADDYLDLVEEKLWHPRSPGLAAVADIELRHRLRWVELTRGPEGLKLGEAIKTSMSELAGAWQFGPESPMSAHGQKRKQTDKDRDGYVIQESKGGTAICHSWNSGKCKDGDKCPANRLHICDIKGCGKKHRRVEHRKPVQ